MHHDDISNRYIRQHVSGAFVEGVEVRPATRSDQDGVHALAASYGNLSHWPERPDYLDHELATGILVVAVSEDTVVGFAGVLERGEVAFLADLFVHVDLLGRGIGRAILDVAFDHAPAPLRATCASGDPRAVPLYESFGMRPIAPLLYLSGDRAAGLRLEVDEMVEPSTVDDPEVIELDARTGPRRRAQEFAFLSKAGAFAMVARAGGEAAGAAVVRVSRVAGSGHPREAFVSPSFARTEEAAGRAVLGAARVGATRAEAVHAAIAEPHPALGPMLDAGFRIVDRDTIMASRADLFDVTRCAPSPELG
jgi:GNAT superfamily N-acetyltransferase